MQDSNARTVGFLLQERVSFFCSQLHDMVRFSKLTLQHHYRKFAFSKCDLNHLDGNISSILEMLKIQFERVFRKVAFSCNFTEFLCHFLQLMSLPAVGR